MTDDRTYLKEKRKRRLIHKKRKRPENEITFQNNRKLSKRLKRSDE